MITANLPARDFDETEAFYHRLGFETRYRDDGWMILEFEGSQVEFFPHPELDPLQSWFSACLRIRDMEALQGQWAALGLPHEGVPRLTDTFQAAGGPPMFALIDPNGSLWRVMGDD